MTDRELLIKLREAKLIEIRAIEKWLMTHPEPPSQSPMGNYCQDVKYDVK